MPDLPSLKPSLWTFRKVKQLVQQVVSNKPNISQQRSGQRFDLEASSGNFYLEIVGESHYQDVLRELLIEDTEFTQVNVECEPTNKFDPDAVRISVPGGRTIGYLARNVAAEYCEVISEIEASGRRVTCFGKLFGGHDDKPSIGVWIDLLEVGDLEDLAG
jgi:hypothetical protein